MRLAYDVQTVRTAEAAAMAGRPDGELMQRAATGLAAVCARLLRDAPSAGRGLVVGARIVLLVGTGNNGGDALWAGAQLARRGAEVVALLVSEKAHAEGRAALQAAGGRCLLATDAAEAARGWLGRADLVLDGILGIGGSGGLREPAATLARLASEGPGLVVAVDVPSGVDADTGTVAGDAVSADLTVTFGSLKPGLLVDPGAAHVGALTLVDIGLQRFLGDSDSDTDSDTDSGTEGAPALRQLEVTDLASLLPQPARESDKYRRGVVGVRAGTDRYPGAAVLCTGSAARSGAGMVRYVGPDAAASHVLSAWPEVVVGLGRVQAWTLGSGLGVPEDVGEEVVRALRDDAELPAVLDAGALPLITELPQPQRFLLTPHAGELARLLGVERAEVEAHRLRLAVTAAERFGATVLLKGSTTLVASPGEAPWVNATGTSALATAGSGDVLAGLCGTLLAGGLPPGLAGAAGAWLHGLAGRLAAAADDQRGPRPIVAADVVAALPAAFAAASVGSGLLP